MTDHDSNEGRPTPTPAGLGTLSIIDALSDIIAVLDSDGRIVRVNEAWTEFGHSSGASEAVCLGVGIDYLAECRRAAGEGSADAASAIEAIEDVLRGERIRRSVQYSCPRPDRMQWFELTVSCLGVGTGAVLVHRDVSALRNAQDLLHLERESPAGSIIQLTKAVEQLQRLERRDRGLLNAIPDLIFEIDRDARILSFRPARGFDPYVPPGEFLGRRVNEVLPPPAGDRLADAVTATFAAGRSSIVLYELEVRGETREYEARLIPLSPETAVAIIRDDTELRRQQREEDRRSEVDTLEGLVERQLMRRNPYRLTFRELTVLNLVAAGLADKEIAERLVLSVYTVNKHVANILAKMQAQSRTQAAMRAQREGLLNPD